MGLVRKPSWRGPGTRGGLGAAYSSAADLAANPYINCNGIAQYLDPFCWSIWRSYSAATFPNPPMPPAVGGTLPGGAPIPAVPPDAESPQLVGVNAGQIIQSITDQQIADTQAQNQSFFENLNESLNPAGAGINWWFLVGLAGALGLLAVAVGGGAPRRYGR